jgi:hypothetical protein
MASSRQETTMLDVLKAMVRYARDPWRTRKLALQAYLDSRRKPETPPGYCFVHGIGYIQL